MAVHGVITISSNDGNGNLVTFNTMYMGSTYDMEIRQDGIVFEGLKSDGTQIPAESWTYEGQGKFLGLSTTSGATAPDDGCSVGSTIKFEGLDDAYYYIVEEELKGEPPTAESVKSKLQSLITASNAKTGKSDANLTDAVKTLLEGFGSGEGIFAEEENEHGTTIVLGADLQEKTIDITANGTVEVTPDEGYALKKVTAKVDVKSEGVDKVAMWIELHDGVAAHMFYQSKCESVDEYFYGADTSGLKKTSQMFYYCQKLTSVPFLNTSNVTSTSNMFKGCSKLAYVPLLDTRKSTSFSSMFDGCSSLAVIPPIDLRSADINSSSSYTSMFNGCIAMTECFLRNIAVGKLQISNGTSYGHLLTLENLLSLCKECLKHSYMSGTLTIGTPNLAKLEGIYVKLIDITDDMRAEDDLIDEKYPFVQCESTDEGAMTIQDYMATKKWSLA